MTGNSVSPCISRGHRASADRRRRDFTACREGEETAIVIVVCCERVHYTPMMSGRLSTDESWNESTDRRLGGFTGRSPD